MGGVSEVEFRAALVSAKAFTATSDIRCECAAHSTGVRISRTDLIRVNTAARGLIYKGDAAVTSQEMTGVASQSDGGGRAASGRV